MTIFLARPQGEEPIPVTFNTGQHGNRTVLTFQAEKYYGVLFNTDPQEFAQTLRRMADRFDPPSVQRLKPTEETWDWCTPAQVISYFEQSPVLQSLTADVRNVLQPLVEQAAADGRDRAESDLDRLRPLTAELLDEAGQVRYGAQSRIAEILELPATGGSYRRRILQALAGLKRAA